jgi:hypothetical protein
MRPCARRPENNLASLTDLRSAVSALAAAIGIAAEPALAESVPFRCIILPGAEAASIMITNSLGRDASCMVTCRFSTTRYNNNPQISCAKPVPAGMELEMCQLPSGGDKMVALTEGFAECTR